MRHVDQNWNLKDLAREMRATAHGMFQTLLGRQFGFPACS
jgi:hypothetical protein